MAVAKLQHKLGYFFYCYRVALQYHDDDIVTNFVFQTTVVMGDVGMQAARSAGVRVMGVGSVR